MVCLVIPAHAQEMTSPIPAELKECDYMIGHWVGKMTMPTGTGKDMEMDGTLDIEKTVDGHYIRQSHKLTGGGMGDMSGMLMLTYDPVAKSWRSWWFDSSAPGVMEFSGNKEGDAMVLTSKPTDISGQSGLVMRSTWKKLSDTKAAYTIDMKEGDKWTTFLSGRFEKKG